MCLGIFRLRRGPKGPTSPKPFPIFLIFLCFCCLFFFWDVAFALFLFDVMVFLVWCLGDGPKLSFPMFWLFCSGFSRVYVVVGVVTCWLLVFFLPHLLVYVMLTGLLYCLGVSLVCGQMLSMIVIVIVTVHLCKFSFLHALAFLRKSCSWYLLSLAVSSLRWCCPVCYVVTLFNADPW